MNYPKFKLTPAYCLFNGVAVMEQNGNEIKFLLEDDSNSILKERLTKAFSNYLRVMNQRYGKCDFFSNLRRVVFVKGTRDELKKYISELYEKQNENDDVSHEGKNSFSSGDENAAAVMLLDSILHDAKECKASDIHIERNTVRFRINGRLENKSVLQKDKAGELVQRIKLLSGMNVIERRKSQDGHFIYGEKNPLFVRVSTMAVIGENDFNTDESVVLRLLDTTRVPLSLMQLGFSAAQHEGIKSLCSEKNGLIIICGPTGAGKSTTATSMLVEIQRENEGRMKIISLEDPPEYIIPGVTQIQIDESRNNNYDNALQHIFRQDPDVIMIGEIRDEKSAVAAIRASLTGHLVIATLHTSSAALSVLRLENLGIGRKIIASILKGVIVQDLNFSDDNVSLLADVALPDYSFPGELTDEMNEMEIEKLFNHITNYGEAITRKYLDKSDSHLLPVFQMSYERKDLSNDEVMEA